MATLICVRLSAWLRHNDSVSRLLKAPIKGLGFLDTPIKGKAVLKAAAFLVVVFLLGLSAVFIYSAVRLTPPKERTLIESFQAHRAAYERLREMFLEDQQVTAVYIGSGVETTRSVLPHTPQEVKLPVERYNEYVALLKEAGTRSVFRFQENNVEGICSFLWVSRPREVLVCTMDRQPENQVTSLDDYYRDPKRRSSVFRHIEGSWYLLAKD